MKKINRTLRKCCLSGLISLALCAPIPAVYAASIETGYSPEGTALQLVLKTIDSAQQEIRMMGYSFTSPEVAGALVRAKRRGVDVKVVLDWKANTGKQNQASLAATILKSGLLTTPAPLIGSIQRTCLSYGMIQSLLNAICSTGRPAGRRGRTGNGLINAPQT